MYIKTHITTQNTQPGHCMFVSCPRARRAPATATTTWRPGAPRRRPAPATEVQTEEEYRPRESALRRRQSRAPAPSPWPAWSEAKPPAKTTRPTRSRVGPQSGLGRGRAPGSGEAPYSHARRMPDSEGTGMSSIWPGSGGSGDGGGGGSEATCRNRFSGRMCGTGPSGRGASGRSG